MANFSLTSIPIFQGDNYDFWSIQMRTLFISQGLWELVENDNQKQIDEENKQRDAKALFIIQQGVNTTLFQEIKDATTSKDAWKTLKDKFNGSNKSAPQPEKKGVSKCFESLKEWLIYEDKGKWIEQMRGMLSLVATVISTMTFQAAISSPGGADDKSRKSILADDKSRKSILETEKLYGDFILFNTISFGASLGVTVLLVSGIPLKHSFPIWLLSIGMCITLTFLGLTYYNGIQLANRPGSTVDEAPPPGSRVEEAPPPGSRVDEEAPLPGIRFIEAAYFVWSIFIVCIALILTIRFVIWLVYVGFRKLKPSSPTNQGGLC